MKQYNKSKEQNYKYFWYSENYGISDDFDSKEECEKDAHKNYEENHYEYGIYCYDANEFPNGDISIDDCDYLGYFGN